MSERRLTVRHATCLPVMVKIAETHSACERKCVTRDVSVHGIYFLTDINFLLPGTSIEIVLKLSHAAALADDIHLRCQGRVLRVDLSSRPYGIAATIEQYEFLPAMT